MSGSVEEPLLHSPYANPRIALQAIEHVERRPKPALRTSVPFHFLTTCTSLLYSVRLQLYQFHFPACHFAFKTQSAVAEPVAVFTFFTFTSDRPNTEADYIETSLETNAKRQKSVQP